MVDLDGTGPQAKRDLNGTQTLGAGSPTNHTSCVNLCRSCGEGGMGEVGVELGVGAASKGGRRDAAGSVSVGPPDRRDGPTRSDPTGPIDAHS